MTHICVTKLTTIGSDNGLSPGRHPAIIWTDAGILLIGPLGTNFSENLIEIYTFSFTKMHLKISSEKWRPFCLGLNVLKPQSQNDPPYRSQLWWFPNASRISKINAFLLCTDIIGTVAHVLNVITGSVYVFKTNQPHMNNSARSFV